MNLEESYRFFFKSNDLKNFLKVGLNTSRGKDYPYQDYFAFNFKNDELSSMKFYFSFFRYLQPREVEAFLPNISDFDRFYGHWREQKHRNINHTGCAFAIKLSKDLIPTYQFHFRYPMNTSLEPPKLIQLSPADLHLYQGISFEYTGDEVLKKDYYYLKNSPSVFKLLNKMKEPNLNQVIEYTETDRWSKIIHWFDRVSTTQKYIKENAGKNLNSITDEIYTQLGCVPLYPGIYENQNVRSIYFFKPTVDADQFFFHKDHKVVQTLKPIFSDYL